MTDPLDARTCALTGLSMTTAGPAALFRTSEPPSDIRGRIAHALGVAIVRGDLAPGDPLVGEGRFSTEQGVSRGVYREAIRILAAKGLVHSRTRSGTRVNLRARWNMLDMDVLAWMAEGGVTRQFIDGVFELRRIVETSAAALAAERRSDDHLARMTAALDEMARHGLSCEAGRVADRMFHLAILEATGNEPLMTLADSVAAALEWTTRLARDGRRHQRDAMPDHRAVLRAIAGGDAAAAHRAMATLIDNASSDAIEAARTASDGSEDGPG